MQRRWTVTVLAVCLLAAACAKKAPTAATQIMVAITSDLMPESELSRIEIQLGKRDGSDLVSMRDFPLVAKDPKPGQQKLPVTFSIVKGHEDTFLLVVSGYGPLGKDGADEKVVEQRAIATFQDHTTLLLQIFLGGVCLHELCGDTGKQVCTPAKVGANKAGECIAVPTHNGDDLTPLDPGMLPDFSLTPKGVEHADAGANDAGDASNIGDAGGTGGTSGTGGAGGAGGTGGTGGMGADPCDTNHGGCDALVRCVSNAVKVTCLNCPVGYDDTNHDGTLCTDIDECATNNGGCGDATYWLCTNNTGTAPPACKDLRPCSASNVCTADYACENLSAACYACAGQYAMGTPSDSPNTFTVNGNGTVTDSRSGLVWQQRVDGVSYTWDAAKTHCSGLSLAGTGWRLPTKAELESIVDFSRISPAIDPTAFPSTYCGFYWSSSAWIVDFCSGASANDWSSPDTLVRCVR